MRSVLPPILAGLVLAAAPAAGEGPQTQRVQFHKGKTGATVQGKIRGYDAAHFLVGAAAGQEMVVLLETRHGATYFNVFAPGAEPGRDAALFVGETGGKRFEGKLAAPGDYLVQVYMMRSAARRNETAAFSLTIQIDGVGTASGPPARDAIVPGTPFHATGNVPCSMGGGKPAGSCPFGVTRAGNGGGTVTVTRPDGKTRVIFFEKGKATGYDRSQADPTEFSARRESDTTIVTIGTERYEIPDAVVFGG